MQRLNVIGPAVRRLRVGRGLTQEALTARCQLAGWNLSRPTIGKIEAGLRQVTDAELWISTELDNRLETLNEPYLGQILALYTYDGDAYNPGNVIRVELRVAPLPAE